MDVSIIIVNWNTRELLRNCLKSIYENTCEADYEIIVVDNASDDGSADMVRSSFSDVRLITNTANRGLAAANNQGIRISEGRYVLLLNSDTVICDGSIDKMVRYADARPRAAVFGCQVWENEDTIQPTSFRHPSLLNVILRMLGLARMFKYNRFFGREMMLWWRRDTARQVDVISGMFMLVRREAIEQVGLMDESYFLYYEESDWCYRFSKAAWKVLFWPGAKIIHLDGGNKSSDQNALKMKIQYHKSMLIFFRKHYGLINSILARLLMSVDAALRCAGCTTAIVFNGLFEKKTACELKQMQEHWGAFKFCVFGSEPA